MSNGNGRGLRSAVLLITLALIAFAAAGQEMKPTANILLPYFEIRIPEATAPSSEDTHVGLVNASPEPLGVEFTVYTNWGIPVLQFTDQLARTEARVLDLHAWVLAGKLPDRTLTAAELAELQAALTGRPSPSDQLYRSTLVEERLAVGYVIMRTSGPANASLLGDTYSLDPMRDYFQGDTLATLDDQLQAECSRHAIRFVNKEELFESTELIIWTGRSFQPSPTTEPIGDPVRLVSSIYDAAGNHVSDCTRELIAVQLLPACQLENLPEIGWLDMKLDQKSLVQEHLHSVTSASAELHAWCLPPELSLDSGPAIDIEKYVNHLDADRSPGAQVPVGGDLHFSYSVTNTGAVPLQNIVVTDSDGLTVTCPRTTLEPREFMVCTAEAVAQPCAHKNIGTVVAMTAAGREVKDQDAAWYTGTYDASLALEKRVNGHDADTPPGLEAAEDDPLTFTFEVTNTGKVKLTKIKVTDSAGIAVTCPSTELLAGASMTCTAPPVPAAVGQNVNVATVTGQTPCHDEVSATDAAHSFVPGENRPAIDVEKYVNGLDADTPPGPLVAVESVVQFRYVITNGGNVALTGVEMEDEALLTCTRAELAPGASFECTTSAIAVAGQHQNLAKAHGHWRDRKIEDSDPGHYLGGEAAAPAIDLEKYVNGVDADNEVSAVHVVVGRDVMFTFEVRNTGNLLLANVEVTDSTGAEISCPKNTLSPGEKMTCTMHVVAVEGLHTNVGTATGVAGGADAPTTVTDSDPANYVGDVETHPAIRVEKLANGADADTEAAAVHVAAGTQVLFSYVVTNTGDVRLTSVTVTDDTGLAVTCPKTILEAGESMTCTASTTALLGKHGNVGTATGKPSTGANGSVSDTDPAHYFGEYEDTHPAIAVEKRVNGNDADTEATELSVVQGSTLQFTFVVTNTGDVGLSNVSVTDNTGLAVTCPKTSLAPDESMTCIATETAVIGRHTNIATATGTPVSGDPTPVKDTDPAYYIGNQHPSLALEKRVNGNDADLTSSPLHVPVGSTLTFTYVTTNTGDVRLTNVSVTDDTGLTVTCPKTTLDPGESMTCTAQSTAQSGLHTNIGTATGTPPNGPAVTASDPASYYGDSPQGCTPGYWKNHTDSWPPAGYSTSQAIDTVFASVNVHFPTLGNGTLLQALSFAGGPGAEGAAEILLRAAVAALLNAEHPGVTYPRLTAAVIGDVNAALATNSRDSMLALAAALDADNNRGCPLN